MAHPQTIDSREREVVGRERRGVGMQCSPVAARPAPPHCATPLTTSAQEGGEGGEGWGGCMRPNTEQGQRGVVTMATACKLPLPLPGRRHGVEWWEGEGCTGSDVGGVVGVGHVPCFGSPVPSPGTSYWALTA